MKIASLAGAIGVMAWLALSPASAAPGWRKFAEWGADVLAQSAIGGAADWMWEMVHDDGPPRPVIGIEPLGSAILSTCADANFQFVDGRPDQSQDHWLILMATGRWNAAEQVLTDDFAMARLHYFGGAGTQIGAFDPKRKMFAETRSPVVSDPAEAARCLAFPARHGLAAAQIMLGYLYLSGQAGAKNLSAFFQLEQGAAATAYPAAEYDLGLAYCYGYGVPAATEVTVRIQRCNGYLTSAALHRFPLAAAALRKLRLSPE